MLGGALSPPPPPTAPAPLARRSGGRRSVPERAGSAAPGCGFCNRRGLRGTWPTAARGPRPPAASQAGAQSRAPSNSGASLATGRKLPDQQPETLRFFVARSTASGSVACALGRPVPVHVHGDDDARRTVSLAEVARPRVQPPFSSRQRAAATTATTTSRAARHPARATRTRAPQLAAALAGSQATAGGGQQPADSLLRAARGAAGPRGPASPWRPSPAAPAQVMDCVFYRSAAQAPPASPAPTLSHPPTTATLTARAPARAQRVRQRGGAGPALPGAARVRPPNRAGSWPGGD